MKIDKRKITAAAAKQLFENSKCMNTNVVTRIVDTLMHDIKECCKQNGSLSFYLHNRNDSQYSFCAYHDGSLKERIASWLENDDYYSPGKNKIKINVTAADIKAALSIIRDLDYKIKENNEKTKSVTVTISWE